VAALVAAMTALRLTYAGAIDLRTDEAYYWTWSKESALSFLDHPPMIAWFIRFGTAIFGDTGLGVRFAGIVAMLVTQLLLADIVRRVTHDVRAVVLAVLMPEAALYYGLLMAKVAPDVAMIPFAVAMLWALVRLHESGDGRWWLAAGVFGGLALLSKFTVVMLLPAVAAFMLVPAWRRRWLFSPYPFAAALIAVAVFSPVLIWNAQHDWASFRFQFVRAVATHELSLRTVGDYIGLQFGLVGFVLLPVVISAGRCGRHPAVDRRDRPVLLLLLEVADASGRRYLADVHMAGRICCRRHQHRAAAAGRFFRTAHPVVHWLGLDRDRVRHRLRRAGVPLLRRRAVEFPRIDRSDRQRGGL
jgi:4-amino-4-deoxy-L-arabinose transferase-like glycosyltransferase